MSFFKKRWLLRRLLRWHSREEKNKGQRKLNRRIYLKGKNPNTSGKFLTNFRLSYASQLIQLI